ncbi:hypothetical protein, partial [Sodalis sp.]|uniref:hypothetical protein n=1 Tax=Sodalis sp. (in: enterobacteria) TaxID=1898979 RepID=UPI0038730B66
FKGFAKNAIYTDYFTASNLSGHYHRLIDSNLTDVLHGALTGNWCFQASARGSKSSPLLPTPCKRIIRLVFIAYSLLLQIQYHQRRSHRVNAVRFFRRCGPEGKSPAS